MKSLDVAYVLIVVIVLFSCTKEEYTPPLQDVYDNYAPLQAGSILIYSVDSIVYNDFAFPVSVDTFQYLVQYEIIEYEMDAEGYANYKVSRSIKKKSHMPWKLDRVFRLRKNHRELIKIDNNVPLVSLVFPAKEGKQWNGNAYNASAEQIFEYRNVQGAEDWDSVKFLNTLEVIEKQNKNLLEDNFSMKQYASGIGVIKKQEHSLHSNFDGEIQSGYRVEYSLVIE